MGKWTRRGEAIFLPVILSTSIILVGMLKRDHISPKRCRVSFLALTRLSSALPCSSEEALRCAGHLQHSRGTRVGACQWEDHRHPAHQVSEGRGTSGHQHKNQRNLPLLGSPQCDHPVWEPGLAGAPGAEGRAVALQLTLHLQGLRQASVLPAPGTAAGPRQRLCWAQRLPPARHVPGWRPR